MTLTIRLARAVTAFADGIATSTRPEDRALAEKYVAAIGSVLARSVVGEDVAAKLPAIEHLLGTTWVVDAAPFQAAFAAWRACQMSDGELTLGATRHFEAMSRFVLALGSTPAEIVEHHYHASVFGSWHCVVRHRGVLSRVVFDGHESELRVERAESALAPYAWAAPVWQRAGVSDWTAEMQAVLVALTEEQRTG